MAKKPLALLFLETGQGYISSGRTCVCVPVILGTLITRLLKTREFPSSVLIIVNLKLKCYAVGNIGSRSPFKVTTN